MCIECRIKLDKLIKEKYKQNNFGKRYPFNKVLTTGFDYCRDDKILYMTIKNVIANMQNYCGAFDSWALIIKNWVSEIDRIILVWERPENINNPHYQRFLYRVQKATEIFNWMEVEEECKPLLDDLRIKPDKEYVVNVPLREVKANVNNKEGIIERMFVKCHNNTLATAIGMDNNILYNQLPVGLFKNNIATANEILPGGNAMIDLWGLNIEERELHIFEIKAPNKDPIGIYSELFFYAMFEKDIINKKFIYKNISTIKDYRGIHYYLNIKHKRAEVKYIRAHFLVTKLHPLMDEKLMETINDALNGSDIKFDCIYYHLDIERKNNK